MIIYLPMIVYEAEGLDAEVCDYILNGYRDREEAERMHPGVEIKVIEMDFPFSSNGSVN